MTLMPSAPAFITAQEAFWAGEFGRDYVARNEHSPQRLAKNLMFFSKILHAIPETPASVIEFGANIGLNLRALGVLLPEAHLTALEINDVAVARLHSDEVANEVIHDSILTFTPTRPHDLAFIKGVLIHINPDELPKVYRKLAEASTQYVMIAEYYNRRPDEVNYRGHEGRLFRRDFGGHFQEICPEFRLLDYGFSYHRDLREGADDLTWWLFEKPLTH